ncbi:hypothetical protein DFJ74DRAFT_670489 [Hyaloraphidium curvatum]|nr:hypothetical protein DFJ74DRAFT_670489 [Hyaloraphidium curvatum]
MSSSALWNAFWLAAAAAGSQALAALPPVASLTGPPGACPWAPPPAGSLKGEAASTKPFRTFADFFPFYLTEHAEPRNRLLHFVGTSIVAWVLCRNPETAAAMVGAGALGVALTGVLQGWSNGAAEGLAVLAAFAGLNRALGKKWTVTATPVFVGYFFAWVGHFGFEKNRPATFIYPTFSLMGDFKMWFGILTGSIRGIGAVDEIF